MRPYLVLLVGPALVTALVLQRHEWDSRFEKWKKDKPQILVDAFSKAKGMFVKAADDANEYGLFEDYQRPNQYVKVILSVGDSYTAGIGSNGPSYHYKDSGDFANGGCGRYSRAWPEALRDSPRWKEQQGDGWRKNNFGACSGAVLDGIISKQLVMGENKDEDMFKKIGQYPNAPQIAVLTAGGNDMQFSTMIKQCIYSVPFTGSCDKTLNWAEHRLRDPVERRKLMDHYQQLYADIIVKGRAALAAGGPTKPEYFQVFQGTYVPFFDEEDEVCDMIDWSIYNIGGRVLLKGLRKRLNNLVRELNQLIREAADEYKKYGVFWVDSYIDKFNSHRYCTPTGFGFDADLYAHGNGEEDRFDSTWFWSLYSAWEDGNEGDHLTNESIRNRRSLPNITNAILDHLKIDQAGRDKIAQGVPWDQISPAFKDEETYDKSISTLEVKDKDGKVIINLRDNWNRIFHPKGKALGVIADSFFDAIVAQRDWNFDKSSHPPSSPPPSSTPTPPKPAPTSPAPAKPSLSVQVFFVHTHNPWARGLTKTHKYNWEMFKGKAGEGIDPCKNTIINTGGDNEFNFPDPAKDSNPGWLPNGEFKVKIDDQICVYQGLGEERPGKDVGWLRCPDRTVKCEKDFRFAQTYTMNCIRAVNNQQYYHAVAYCDW